MQQKRIVRDGLRAERDELLEVSNNEELNHAAGLRKLAEEEFKYGD